MKDHTNILQRWAGPKPRQDADEATWCWVETSNEFQNRNANHGTPPVNRRHPGDASFTAKPLRGFSLWLLIAALALAASAGPATNTTQTAVPNRPAGIGAARAINSSGTPVGTQRLERPDQVPNGL